MAKQTIEDFTSNEYKYGFSTDVETEVIPIGLNEDVVRLISKKKNEPEWLLDFRLKAFAHWQKSTMPTWAKLNIPPIDYQANRNIAVKANIVYCDKISIPSDFKNGMTIICFYIVLQIFF